MINNKNLVWMHILIVILNYCQYLNHLKIPLFIFLFFCLFHLFLSHFLLTHHLFKFLEVSFNIIPHDYHLHINFIKSCFIFRNYFFTDQNLMDFCQYQNFFQKVLLNYSLIFILYKYYHSFFYIHPSSQNQYNHQSNYFIKFNQSKSYFLCL